MHRRRSRSPSRDPDYSRGDRRRGALRAPPSWSDRTYSIARNNHNPMETAGHRSPLGTATGSRCGTRCSPSSRRRPRTPRRSASPPTTSGSSRPFVGGAFGSAGQTWPHQLLAAFAARQIRRPVKLSLTRKQIYAAIGYRPTSRQRMAIAADRSGRIVAIVHESRSRDRPVRHLRGRSHRVHRSSCTPVRTCGPPTASCRST